MYKGSIVALVTPMAPDGGLDFPALERLIDWHVACGTAAIVSVGTTGESPTLDMDEHREVIAHTVRHAAGRIPVIAGTGSNSTTEAIELTQAALADGADAALLVTPYYNKPTQEGMYAHFRAIAEAAALPQILYNVPGRTACDLLTDTVVRLAELPNIVGLKDATGGPERARELLARRPDGFALYSGEDSVACELMLAGYDGVISVTANVAPERMREMSDLALAGQEQSARALDASLQPLHRDLFREANPIPVKWALNEMGRIDRGIRLPLTALSDTHHGAVRSALASAGALQGAADSPELQTRPI